MHIITREYQTGSVGLRDDMGYTKEARRTLDFYGLITFESTPGFAFFMLLVVNIKKVSKVFFSAFTIIATQKDAVTHYSQHNSSVKCGIKMCIFSSVYVARTDKVSSILLLTTLKFAPPVLKCFYFARLGGLSVNMLNFNHIQL